MPFNRPDLDTLIERVKTDIKGGLGITTVLRRSFISVISRALAGLSHLLFGYLDFISEQVFPDTAEKEFLERWSEIWGVTRNEATFAELNIDIIFTAIGTVPVNTIYQRGDGVQYKLDAEITSVGAETLSGKVIAVIAGDDGNLADAEIISLLSPIANVTSDSAVTSTVVEGEDTESDSSLRSRLTDRLRNPPLGGSANDYIQQTLAVPGVTRAWVLPLNQGPGTVDVTFVEDNDVPIIPDAAKLAEVQAAIDDFKPVTALSVVFAPALAPATLTIEISPNTASVQAAITAELADLMLTDAQIPGAYKNPAENYDGKILLSKIQTSIGIAQGLENYNITLINGGAPGDITPGLGELVTLGVITWQPIP
tara:strand:+ start:15665 stop:16768 length:1104 start_codon:yes stop_codon:yes gene_type:complete